MTIIADLFDDYRKKVMSHDAPTVQVMECQRAFFAGAHGLYYSIIKLMSAEDEVTEQDMVIIESIGNELETFKQSVIAGNN